MFFLAVPGTFGFGAPSKIKRYIPRDRHAKCGAFCHTCHKYFVKLPDYNVVSLFSLFSTLPNHRGFAYNNYCSLLYGRLRHSYGTLLNTCWSVPSTLDTRSIHMKHVRPLPLTKYPLQDRYDIYEGTFIINTTTLCGRCWQLGKCN